MKKFLTGLLLGLSFVATTTYGLSIFMPVQGGTGVSSVPASQLIYGNGVAPFGSVATSTASCSGSASCTPFTIIGSTPITISASGGGGATFTWPWIAFSGYQATSTTMAFLNGFFSTASSTISAPFFLTSLGQGALYTGSSGLVNKIATSTITASTGLTYSGTFGSELGGTSGNLTVNTSQNIATLSNLTTNGFVTTSGGAGTLGVQTFPISVAEGGTGAVTLTGCLTGNGTGAITGSGTCNTSNATVSSVGLATPNSTLTLGGTNPVTTSGTINADLNLGHTNTWTILQNFNYSSSTVYSSFQTASSTSQFAGTLNLPNISSTQCLHSINGVVSGTGTDCGSSAGITSFTGGLGLLGGVITNGQTLTSQLSTSSIPTLGQIPYWTGLGTASSPATLGSIATTTASCSGSTSCTPFTIIGSSPVTISSSGGSTSFAWPFSIIAGQVGTTTTLGFFNGLFSTASSTLSSSLFLPSLSQGSLYTGTNGLVGTTATTTVSCSGSASCTQFVAFGSSPITISASGGGGATFTWPWTPFTGYQATSTTMAFLNGFFSTASSTLSGPVYFPNLSPSQGFAYIGSAGQLNDIATSSLNLPNSALANSTISGVALGGTLANHSHDSSFTGTTYNGSATVSDWGLALNHTNTWSVLQNFNYSSSTIDSTFVLASTTNLIVSADATTTRLTIGPNYQTLWRSGPDYIDTQNIGASDPFTEQRLLSNLANATNGAESTYSMVVDCSGQNLFNNQIFFDHTTEIYPTSYQAILGVGAAGNCAAAPLVIRDVIAGGNKDRGNHIVILPNGTTGILNAATSSVPTSAELYVASSTATQVFEVDSRAGTASALGDPIITALPSGFVGIDNATPYSLLTVSTSSTDTVFGDQNVAIRINNKSNTTNNWDSLVFDDAGGSAVSSVEAQITNQASHFGGLTFSSRSATGYNRILDLNGNAAGFSTTSPKWKITVASTTMPQLALEGADTDNIWTMRGIGNTFAIATASPLTFATSTANAFTIDSNGITTLNRLKLGTTTAGCAAVMSTGEVTSTGTACGSGGGSGTVTSVGLSLPAAFTVTNSPVTTSGTLTATLNFPANSILTSSSNGTNIIATTSQLTVGSLISTTTAVSWFNGFLGQGTTTPFANVSINPTVGNPVAGSPAFVIGSSTATDLAVTPFGCQTGGDCLDIATTTTGAFSLVFTSKSYLGIGTTTPFGALSVNPSLLGSGVPEFVIGSSSATHLLLTGGGFLGLGTTTPAQMLSVNGKIYSASGGIQFPDGTLQTTAAVVTHLYTYATTTAITSAISGQYATSTLMGVPVSTLTASSTIVMKVGFTCAVGSTSTNQCIQTVVDDLGDPFVSFAVTGISLSGTFTCSADISIQSSSNSVSSQISTVSGSCENPAGAGGVAFATNLQTSATSAVNLSNARSFGIKIQANGASTSQSAPTLNFMSIIATP